MNIIRAAFAEHWEYPAALAAVIVTVFVILCLLLAKNSHKNNIIANQVSVISAIYETLPDLVFCKDIDGRYISCNHAYEIFAGREEKDLIGKLPHEINVFVDELAKTFAESDNRAIETKSPVRFEEWFTYPDKTRRYFETIKTPLIKDGAIIGLLGVSRDITAFKSALEAGHAATAQIREANERINIMLDATPLCCQIWDRNLNTVDCNEAAVKLYGLNNKQEYLDRFYELSPEYQPDGQNSAEKVAAVIQKAFDEGRYILEWMHQTLDGTQIPAEITLVRVKYKNEYVVAGYTRDLREHKKMMQEINEAMEAAQRASQAKSAFLSRMSHEIRTPMNAITGMTELALREDIPEAAREHIITVKQASANLLAIINDILDFSKIEQGKLQIVPAQYLFSSMINDVISIIRMRTIDSQIRFVVSIDSNIPNEMFGDEMRIRQVLINLLGNAVKYTEKGFVSLNVYGEIIDKNENVINLTAEVQDSGRGIHPEDIDKLFVEFSQVDVEKNKGIEGVGLGLAITHSIIKAMDGSVTVQSEYGRGSLFTVTLPQKICSPKKLASVENPADKKVLVYERRAIYADSIMRNINNLGAPCTLISNDDELREKMENEQFDFIILAFMLFNKNRDFILKYGPKCKIILLTEFGESIRGGSWSVIAMPVSVISIANILNGISDNFSYNNIRQEPDVAFTAPEARVLVVDDINTNLKVAEGLLLPYKMQVDLRKGGLAAIEAITSSRYDLIFMDHRMPDVDGIEATRRIRAMGSEEPYYSSVPIIALTANAVAGMREMFVENGFNDFLSKPIDTVKLNGMLEKWIQRRKNKPTGAEELENKEVAESKFEIEGIDVKKGLFHLGGKFDLYLETLSIYYEDVCEKIEQIKKCIETNNFSLYTTYVHALKSASANIGAVKISETAKALEMAGKENNLSFIDANGENFLAELKTLLDNIQNALKLYNENVKENADALSDEQFKSELIILKEALEDMDAQVIRKTADNLKKSSPAKYTAAIQNISMNILTFDYDEAIIIIDSLIT